MTTSKITTTKTAKANTVTVTVTASTEATSATESLPTTDLTVGQGVSVTEQAYGDEEVAEAEVVLVSVERKAEPDGEYADAPKNGTYVVLDVLIKGVRGESEYNAYDWTVRDEKGFGFDASTYGGFEPSLKSGKVAAGGQARGLIAIDAPTGPIKVEYAPFYGAPATWLVP